MQAHQIQAVVLDALRRQGVHVLKSTLYSLSDDPGEADGKTPEFSDSFIWVAIMTRAEFGAVREACNQRGVWFANVRWLPYGFTGKFIYEALAVEMH